MKPLAVVIVVALSVALLAGCLGAPFTTESGTEIVLLPFPPDGGTVTWDSWAGAFVRDYCVSCHSPEAPCSGSGCHGPGDLRLSDFRDEATFTQQAASIRCGLAAEQDPSWGCQGISPREFPKALHNAPLPTDAQRAIMVDWLTAGTP